MTRLRPGLAALLGAKAVSDVGYALDFVALPVFVWERSHTVLATGLVSVVLYTGAIAGGQVGKRYANRWDRRRAMITADVARMAVLAVLAVLPGGAQIWWLYPAVLLIGVGRSVFEATLSAATPVLAGERAQTVNSVLAGVRGGAFVVGLGGAALVVPVLGYRGVFLLDAASYALSALVLAALRLPMRDGASSGSSSPAAQSAGAHTAAWPLLVAAGVAPLLVLRGFDAFGSSSQQVGLPILSGQLRPGAPTLFAGLVWSAWASGLLLGSFVLRPLSQRLVARSPGRVFCLATIVMSLGFLGVFWLPGWWLRLPAALVAGLGDALSEITFKQALQRLPDDERGPAFGFSQVAINGGFIVGLSASSLVLSPTLVARWVLLLNGVPILIAAWLIAAPGRLRRTPLPQQAREVLEQST